MGFTINTITHNLGEIFRATESTIAKNTTNAANIIQNDLKNAPIADSFRKVSTVFSKPDILDITTQEYVTRINAVPVIGITKEEIPILRMIQESMFSMLSSSKGKSPLYNNIVFTNLRPQGKMLKEAVAYTDGANGNLYVNKDYLENIDSVIMDDINRFIDLGILTKNKDGKYRILDHLRNSKSELFEKDINIYNTSQSLESKVLFHRISMQYYAALNSQARRYPHITIEKIINNSENQRKLKNLGLLKSLTDISQMSKDEQITYLKQIGRRCPPPVSTCLVSYPNMLFNHENIHRWHFDRISLDRLKELSSESKIKEWQDNDAMQIAAAKVSGYARKDPKEFVAEVGAGLANGQHFDRDVISLYEYLKGPMF